MTESQRGGLSDRILSVFSLVLAAFSLMISFLLIFNGSTAQAQFDAKRQSCVDALTDLIHSLVELEVTTSAPNNSTRVEFVANGARSQIECFDTRFIDDKSTFHQQWAKDVQEINADIYPEDAEGTVQSGEGAAAVQRLARSTLGALKSSSKATGPGYFPWQAAGSLSPKPLSNTSK